MKHVTALTEKIKDEQKEMFVWIDKERETLTELIQANEREHEAALDSGSVLNPHKIVENERKISEQRTIVSRLEDARQRLVDRNNLDALREPYETAARLDDDECMARYSADYQAAADHLMKALAHLSKLEDMVMKDRAAHKRSLSGVSRCIDPLFASHLERRHKQREPIAPPFARVKAVLETVHAVYGEGHKTLALSQQTWDDLRQKYNLK
ncbi:hypothetical protein PA598K_06883 [Paenibacillus sp. 598K]|uniref:hypothetical protein n=1 Tax=Paenibacillus sp. 598K TaxID=1117987 RepID=UPI000FF923D2|nr:hypothetical protein [Paenibacillus sp. 598K]GBF78265.1 hypothetical protein PA598K_06883 [Paenibacillus sp. 598K]